MQVKYISQYLWFLYFFTNPEAGLGWINRDYIDGNEKKPEYQKRPFISD